MGVSIKVWREKIVIKPAPGKRQCKCRNEIRQREIAPGMFYQISEPVCGTCPNVKYVREGDLIIVDIEKGMQDGQEILFNEDGEPKIDGEPGDLKFKIRKTRHERLKREGSDLCNSDNFTARSSGQFQDELQPPRQPFSGNRDRGDHQAERG
ncbi:unnamed protein product [Urochloa humidicola]